MADAVAVQDGESQRRRVSMARKLAGHRSFRIGFVLIVVLTAAAVVAPLLTGLDPTAMRIRFRFRPPSAGFPFGTDAFGRDVLTRVLYGARLSLWIGLGVAALSGAVGTAAGIVAAQFRRLDGPIMCVMDALLAFPAIILAIGLAAVLGPQTESLIVALSVAYVPRTARIVRAS